MVSAILQDPGTSAPSPLRASPRLLGETSCWGPGACGAWQHPEEQHQPLEQVRMVLGRVLEMCAAEPRERERGSFCNPVWFALCKHGACSWKNEISEQKKPPCSSVKYDCVV